MNITELNKISNKRLKQLDLMVLLSLLYRVGFDADNIIFESRLSLSQSGRLIEDIIFDDTCVKLVVNMGILSANSAIPDRVLDYFSSYDESVSFNILNALASKLLKNQISILLSEQSTDLKDLYLKGDILFTKNDNFFYSLSSFNSLFERVLSRYKLNVNSEWKLDLINKNSHLDKQKNFVTFHLGNKLLFPRLHFDITIQSEVLFDEGEYIQIAESVNQLVSSSHFDANREFVAVNVWIIVHPAELVFIPFSLSQQTQLMKHKIKIYERYSYGY